MNHLLYEYSLCTALALMLFFGFYFILAQTPDKSIFNNYPRSRRTMGAALLVLLAFQLSSYFTARPLLHHAPASYTTHNLMVSVHNSFRMRTVLSTLWNHTKLCTAMHGDMAVRLWHPAGTPLNSGIPACCQIFRRHTFRRYRRVHTLAFHLYILGGHFRCRLRTAYIPARPVYFHMDSFVHSFLYIPVSFIYELPVVL